MPRKLALDSDELDALLSAVDTSAMTDEQKQSIAKMRTEVTEIQKADKLEKVIQDYNDIILANAKEVTTKLPIDIPSCINVIRLIYDFDVEKQMFAPSIRIDTERNIPGVLTETFLGFRHILLENASEKRTKEITTALDYVGKQFHDVDNYSDMIENFLQWREMKHTIADFLSEDTAKKIMGDIKLSDEEKKNVTKGSVILCYNSPLALNKMLKADGQPEVSVGSWIVTTAGFNKSTKYTQKAKSNGNGTRVSAADWIPSHLNAKNARQYLIECFASDDKVVKAIAKHSTDGTISTMDWSMLNAPQHIMRCEKEVAENQRYYTNYKALQSS